MEKCLFCQIIAGEIPSTFVYQDSSVVVFPDINPQAEIHYLIVPRTHYPDVTVLAASDPALLARIISVAQTLADQHSNSDYRLIFNRGLSAGQTIFHVHAHLLSGQIYPQPTA
jgi:histidine triad (HIT) family protein